MNRYYGSVGFADIEDIGLGVMKEVITERRYYGDITRISRRTQNGTGINDNISVSNSISIVADPYAFHHFTCIRYAEWLGSKWKVSNVEVQSPRLILTLGGPYNEQQS